MFWQTGMRSALTTAVLVSFLAAALSAAAQQSDPAGALNEEGVALNERGAYAQAVEVHQRALVIREAVFGADSLQAALSLDNLCVSLVRLGRSREAEQANLRALKIYEALQGPKSDNVALALNNRAMIFNTERRHKEAVPLLLRVVDIVQSIHGPSDGRLAGPLTNLSVIYVDLDRFNEAETYSRRAISIFEITLGKDHPRVAVALQSLAGVLSKEGKSDQAIANLAKAEAILAAKYGDDNAEVTNLRVQLASSFLAATRYQDAIDLLRKVLDRQEESLGLSDEKVASTLAYLAVAYSGAGDLSSADSFARRASAIHVKNGMSNGVALNDILAGAEDRSGNFDEAARLYKDDIATVLAEYGAQSSAYAQALNNLGSYDLRRNRNEEAQRALSTARPLMLKVMGARSLSLAYVDMNLAEAERRAGRLKEAEQFLVEASAIKGEALPPTSPDVMLTLARLSSFYVENGRPKEALLSSERLMEHLKTWGDRYRDDEKDSVLSTFWALKSADPSTSTLQIERAFETTQIAGGSQVAAAFQRLAYRYNAPSAPLAALIRREQDAAGEADKIEADLTQALARGATDRRPGAEKALRARFKEKQDLITSIDRQIGVQYPKLQQSLGYVHLSVADVQKDLAPDEAFVALDLGTNGYAWVVTQEKVTWTKLPGNAATVLGDVITLRKSIEGDAAFDGATSFKVFREAIEPWYGAVAGKAKLFVSANGALTSLPLQVLLTKDPAGKRLKDMDWLVRDHAVTLVPSVYGMHLMKTQSAASKAKRTMIAFADPLFSAKARAEAGTTLSARGLKARSLVGLDARSLSNNLPQLPGTRTEVLSVAKSVGANQDDLHFGRAANAKTLKQSQLDDFRIVYFATHALLSSQLSRFTKGNVEPALVLTFPDRPSDQDDGLLTASDVAQLHLDAEWVVLSACNTAAGDVPDADGLSGLAKSFIFAGARSLLVSHWEVDDDATAALMSDVFRITSEKKALTHGEALREAELAMLSKAATEDDAHPRKWAPFVVLGESAAEAH